MFSKFNFGIVRYYPWTWKKFYKNTKDVFGIIYFQKIKQLKDYLGCPCSCFKDTKYTK